MKLPILAIDKNAQIHAKQSEAALSRGYRSVQVDSMSEGITTLSKGEFLAVAINADNINYLPQLKIMSEAVNAPVLIVINPSNYTVDKHTEAIKNGAFAFGPWADTPEQNLNALLAFVDQYKNLARRPKKTPKAMHHKNIMMHVGEHLAVVNDFNVALTPLEYKILYYIMNNNGRTSTYENIIRYAWGSAYADSSTRALFTKVKDIRKKLSRIDPADEYIVNVRGVGYRLST